MKAKKIILTALITAVIVAAAIIIAILVLQNNLNPIIDVPDSLEAVFEEKELVLFIILDRSLSMMTGSRGKTKLEVASEAAALLTLAAEQNNSPTGAIFLIAKLDSLVLQKRGETILC